MEKETILYLISIAGCLIGITGWLSGRDKKRHDESSWKGSIDSKLDYIHNSLASLPTLAKELTENTEATKSAHKRIDKLEVQFQNLNNRHNKATS